MGVVCNSHSATVKTKSHEINNCYLTPKSSHHHYTIPFRFRDLLVISNVKQLVSLKFFETGCPRLELGPPLRMLLRIKNFRFFLGWQTTNHGKVMKNSCNQLDHHVLASPSFAASNHVTLALKRWIHGATCSRRISRNQKNCQTTWQFTSNSFWSSLGMNCCLLKQTIQLRVINAISHRLSSFVVTKV